MPPALIILIDLSHLIFRLFSRKRHIVSRSQPSQSNLNRLERVVTLDFQKVPVGSLQEVFFSSR